MSASAVICALICLVAVQSVVASARDAAASRSHVHASAIVANDEICLSDASSDAGAPSHRGHRTDHCCIVCASSGRDDRSELLFIFDALADFLALAPAADVAFEPIDDRAWRRVGRRGSNASRAPPRRA